MKNTENLSYTQKLEKIIEETVKELSEKYLTDGTVSVSNVSGVVNEGHCIPQYRIDISYIYENGNSSLFLSLLFFGYNISSSYGEIECTIKAHSSKRQYTSIVEFVTSLSILKEGIITTFGRLSTPQELI